MHSLLTALMDSPAPALLAFSPLDVWGKVWPYLVMILGFSAIIFVHELGHFMVAKWAGVRVDRFSIGFGREVFGFTKGETRYSFSILPLGGYVKMLGQEDFDDKAEELKFKDDPQSFVNKPIRWRMAIVSAGVIMNVIFAFLLFGVVFLIGMDAVAPRIGYVDPDSAADKAGLLAGDVITEINDKRVLEFNDVTMAIVLTNPLESLKFVVERNGEELPPIYVKSEVAVPDSAQEVRRQIIGILPGMTGRIGGLGPEADPNNPRHPRLGDVIVEVAGEPVTDTNATEMLSRVISGAGPTIVERTDPAKPESPPERLEVEIPPVLQLYPSDRDDPGSVHLLGLVPLISFSFVTEGGRADLAGIEPGNAIISFDDQLYPTQAQVARAVADGAGRDLEITLRKQDGRLEQTFVRPRSYRRGGGTVHAVIEAWSEPGDTQEGARARFAEVGERGPAYRAGIDPGDVILEFAGREHPSPAQVRRDVREHRGEVLVVRLRKPDGREVRTSVEPEASGSIQATFGLVADEVLLVGGIVPISSGRPTPAALAGIPAGAILEAVNGTRLQNWRGVIAQFRAHAGETIELAYRDSQGRSKLAQFAVPNCLSTLLGIGPAGRIVSIDGTKTVTTTVDRGEEQVSVAHADGTRVALEQLVGRTQVPVAYRVNPTGETETKYIDVTEEMIDPWVSRIALQTTILTEPETTLLKAGSPWEAVMIGVHKTHYFVLQVYTMMSRMIFTRSVGLDSISGPLGIVDLGGKIAQRGTVKFLFFLAMISANLAVINFLPLPIVDGGLMVFLIIEKIKGSPVSLRVQVATQLIGLFLIVGAFLYVTFNDVLRMFG